MVVYRMKNPYTGEIKETSNLKRLVEISITDLKDWVNEQPNNYDYGVLLIDKVVYGCDDTEWDGAYWEYPVLSEKTIVTLFVSTLSVQITRLSDDKKCIIWRGDL